MADDNGGRVSTRELYTELGKTEGRILEKMDLVSKEVSALNNKLAKYVERAENTRERAKKNEEDIERLERRDWWGASLGASVGGLLGALIAFLKGS